jgi:hypothetical protein
MPKTAIKMMEIIFILQPNGIIEFPNHQTEGKIIIKIIINFMENLKIHFIERSKRFF